MSAGASAPGKLMVLGEYAVLDGAPALVAAVNRRAVVRIEDRPGDFCSIDAPEVAAGPMEFTVTPRGCVEWRTDSDACERTFSLFAFVLERLGDLLAFDPCERGAFSVSLSTRGFFERGQKLGLGSSAALTAALTGALAKRAGTLAPKGDFRTWLARLLTLHADYQAGAGSGADIAASLFGGVIAFERAAEPAASARVEPLAWPDGLGWLCLWTGRSASTRRLLDALERARAAGASRHATHMAQLSDIARRGCAAARAGSARELHESIETYARALEAFDRACDIGIMSAGHARLKDLAAESGVVYKPSGAGGGDVGIALSAEPDRLDRLRASASREGFAAVELKFDPRGLELE